MEQAFALVHDSGKPFKQSKGRFDGRSRGGCGQRKTLIEFEGQLSQFPARQSDTSFKGRENRTFQMPVQEARKMSRDFVRDSGCRGTAASEMMPVTCRDSGG